MGVVDARRGGRGSIMMGWALVVVVGLPVSGAAAEPSVSGAAAEPGSAAPSGTPLADPKRPDALGLGDPMPHFTARRMGPGVPTSLSTRALADDRPIVLSVVASYCAPCRAEVPRLLELGVATGGAQIVLIVVDRDAEGLDAAARWLFDEAKVDVPVVRDRFSLIARRLGVDTVPHVLAFDRRRRLVWQGVGAQTADLTPLAAALARARFAP